MSLKIKFFADNGNWVLHIQIGLFIGFMEHNAPSTNKSLIFPKNQYGGFIFITIKTSVL